MQPWICETQVSGLGPATGPACVAPTRYDYFYKSTATGRFESYDAGIPPADALIARTTTDQGKTVRYIVRRERGVIDRGIYDIAVLHQPGQEWEPWAPQPGWNGKLHWYFQGSCTPSHRQAGDGGVENGFTQGIADVLNGEKLGDLPLSRGWAVAATTLTRLGNNCNDVVSAEMVMMVKEHLAETCGPIRYTTGLGCSGGSLQQHLIANNYPGLLDGLLPYCSWADMLNVAQLFYDCRQFTTYFTNAPTLWADPTDRTAVTGEPAGCAPIGALQGQELWFDPTVGCTTQIPAFVKGVPPDTEPEWVYDPQTNPDGVRCTIQDYQEQVYGHRASDGFANHVMDDTGLQFGLKALLSGRISPEQFVDLNVRIGGRDIDYNPISQRTAADAEGLRNAYRSGRVNDASNLDKVPIIDLRESSNAEVHPDVYSRMTRARLIAANGHADNHIIWTQPFGTDVAMFKQAFLTLDRWVAAIGGDHSTDSLEAKVVRHKPVNATDSCWAGTEQEPAGPTCPTSAGPGSRPERPGAWTSSNASSNPSTGTTTTTSISPTIKGAGCKAPSPPASVTGPSPASNNSPSPGPGRPSPTQSAAAHSHQHPPPRLGRNQPTGER